MVGCLLSPLNFQLNNSTKDNNNQQLDNMFQIIIFHLYRLPALEG